MFSLPTGEDMRLYGQDRLTEEMAMFLRLADKCREHTHSHLRSQAVYLSREARSHSAGHSLLSVHGPGPAGGGTRAPDPPKAPPPRGCPRRARRGTVHYP